LFDRKHIYSTLFANVVSATSTNCGCGLANVTEDISIKSIQSETKLLIFAMMNIFKKPHWWRMYN
jgi:hypothetical protein